MGPQKHVLYMGARVQIPTVHPHLIRGSLGPRHALNGSKGLVVVTDHAYRL